ncbi:single-pass membrane and coiled-coil domain-containing protein 2 isoform X2 [Eptesicus fuscus]|uniref:single-pass membrane and coiled-coil domain-containing protein 2 isoform X2 n=1 Tax=Eptesicus fuscus TaxID=29078 RepID=UPI002403F08E|nr:single-pass membrane and coiled-coil domain-containing protein 2 isoform X2 [Eptesicus fuscus]
MPVCTWSSPLCLCFLFRLSLGHSSLNLEPSQDMLELEAEHDQDLQSKQDEQETHDAQREDPQLSTSLQFSENIPKLSQENMFFQLNHWNTQMGLQVKELGDDHMGWMKKINSIIQKVTLSESTVKSLLSEVMSLEGQVEKLELHQGLDPNKGENIKEKIVEIKKQLGEMDNKFVQVDACNEAHELKEKLVAKIENFCKDMTVMNKRLGMYPLREEHPDSRSPEETGREEMEHLLLQAPLIPSVQNSPPRSTLWKRALRIFIIFYALTFTVLSCYILFFDATFIFERVLPTMLGRRRTWELREIIVPFLNLEVEDLLPS